MHIPKRFFGLLICALLMSGGAVAQSYTVVDQTGAAATRVTGAGAPSAAVSVPNGQMVTRLTWGERADNPCHITLRGETPDGQDSSTRAFADCHRNTNRINSTERSRILVNVPEEYGAVAIRACLNRRGNKVKGIMLSTLPMVCIADMSRDITMNSARRLTARIEGSETLLSTPDRIVTVPCTDPSVVYWAANQRFNCSEWSALSACPSGEVMTGLNLATVRNSRGGQTIEGMAAFCRPLIENDG